MLDWHLVEQHSEDTLLHLTCVLSSENDHFLLGEVDGDTGCAGHTSGVSVGWEATSVVDNIVGVEVLKLRPLRSDEHVSHEEGMVGTGADNTNVDSVSLVPSCVTVDDVDSVSCVEVVNGTFSVDFPDLYRAHVSKYSKLGNSPRRRSRNTPSRSTSG